MKFQIDKVLDNYHKYYTSKEIKPGDTLSSYYEQYGENYKNANGYNIPNFSFQCHILYKIFNKKKISKQECYIFRKNKG